MDHFLCVRGPGLSIDCGLLAGCDLDTGIGHTMLIDLWPDLRSGHDLCRVRGGCLWRTDFLSPWGFLLYRLHHGVLTEA